MKPRQVLIEELNQAVQRAGTLTVLHTNAIADKIGLSATEFEVLDIVSHYQPVNAGQLAKYCGLTTGAITGIIDRLERAGFVKRQTDPKDRRRVLVKPVEREHINRRVRKLYEPVGEAFQDIVGSMTAKQLKFLVDTYACMNDKMQEITIRLRNE